MAMPMTRRRFIVQGGTLAATVACLPLLHRAAGAGSSVAHAATDTNAARAMNAYNAMQKHFYVAPKKLYHEYSPFDGRADNPNSYLWAYEEAAKATLCVSGLPGGAATYTQAIGDRLSGREAYWDGGTSLRGYRSYPRTGDRYYDDNDWVGSDLLQHHLLTKAIGDPSAATALDRARGVFAYVQTGWDESLPKPGGVRWVDATWNGDRGTGPTGGAAKLAAHLYDVTGRQTASYLAWARKAYDWTKTSLLSPQNGLYWDNIRADGAVDADQWIYNQGVMIGANVLLSRVIADATAAKGYLDEAVRLANTTLTVFGTEPYYSGGKGAYNGRGIFNAIFFRNLLMLYAVSPTTYASYRQKMQTYADAAWGDLTVHDPSTGLFKLDGGTRYSLLDQASMVQVYACLAWDPSNYGKLT